MKLHFVERENERERSVDEQKKALRARMKERRANNENRDVKEGLLIENLFTALEHFEGVSEGVCTRRNIFVYLSFSSEAPTDTLIERLWERGYVVYCPRVEGKEMQAVEHGEDMSLSPLGIREPTGEAFTGEMHYVVTPLLAVDERGNRLGYGGGYYDRYFAKNEGAKRIAYAFDFQVQKSVPHEATDKKMDCIVTDKRVIFTDGL